MGEPDMYAEPTTTTDKTCFTPMEFVRQIIDAVTPLLHDDKISPLLKVPFRDLHHALAPLFGHYTVADAAIAHRALDMAISTIKDNDRIQGAVWYAIAALESFMAAAMASSADCAAARARFLCLDADGAAEGEGIFSDAERTLAHQRLLCDIANLRDGHFDGDRFGGMRWISMHDLGAVRG